MFVCWRDRRVLPSLFSCVHTYLQSTYKFIRPIRVPLVIHLAWICKMTSECNKYAFSTLSEVVIRDLQVVIRDLQVVIRDLQRKNLWIIKFQTNGTFSLARRITVYLEPPILATSGSHHWLEV
jgi:hypothetical protein